MNVFTFPANLVFRLVRPGPRDGVFGLAIIILTCFLWACVWAEPFRRSYGWRPWRFSMRELLILTAAIAVIFGGLALLERVVS